MHCTLRHTNPNMTTTLAKVASYIQKPENSPHIFTTGRTEKYEVPDVVNEGFATICEMTDLATIAEEEAGIVEASAATGDIGVS